MAEICMSDIKILKGIFESMKDITDVGTWNFRNDHVFIQEMDYNNISMCSVALDAKDFIHYRCNGNISLTFSFKNMYKILNNIEIDASVKIIYECTTNFMTFIFKEKNKVTTFYTNLINYKPEYYNFPTYIKDCAVTIKSNDFKKIITEMTQINDTCNIQINKLYLSFVSIGEIGTYDVTLNNSKDCFIEHYRDVKVKFNNLFLLNFLKISSLVEFVKFDVTNNTPIIIKYELGVNGNSYIKYYLSPV
jgi:proliferating cell nuclear antigen PCNA